MEPSQDLVDALYRDKVLRAREAPLGEKLLSGAKLFEIAWKRMLDGARAQHPDLDDAGLLELMRRRAERLRRLQEAP